MSQKLAKNILQLQGFYFLVTGVWPLFSIETFTIVTGPKTDVWLVKTFSALITAIGTVILIGSIRYFEDGKSLMLLLGAF
jgi:hypothetical protein